MYDEQPMNGEQTTL